MRSKILPTLYSIVHGPKKKQKRLNKRKLKGNSTCITKPKGNKHFKMHTLVCQNVHTITNSQISHTLIQILQKKSY